MEQNTEVQVIENVEETTENQEKEGFVAKVKKHFTKSESGKKSTEVEEPKNKWSLKKKIAAGVAVSGAVLTTIAVVAKVLVNGDATEVANTIENVSEELNDVGE